jgi:hypothetical protein
MKQNKALPLDNWFIESKKRSQELTKKRLALLYERKHGKPPSKEWLDNAVK